MGCNDQPETMQMLSSISVLRRTFNAREPDITHATRIHGNLKQVLVTEFTSWRQTRKLAWGRDAKTENLFSGIYFPYIYIIKLTMRTGWVFSPWGYMGWNGAQLCKILVLVGGVRHLIFFICAMHEMIHEFSSSINLIVSRILIGRAGRRSCYPTNYIYYSKLYTLQRMCVC